MRISGKQKIAVGFLAFVVTGTVLAKPQKKAVPAKSAQTIGDVLKRIGTEKPNFEKEKSNLPKSEAAFERKTPVNLDVVKPPRSSDIYKIEGDGRDVEYEKLTDKGIKDLYGLVNKFKNSPNRGELWVRLAEFYVEKARLVKFRRYREYEEKMDQYEAKKISRKPVIDQTESREYNQKAVNLYKLFIQDFPKDKKVSQVLFYLGYNYYELGREEEGAKYYKILADKYQKSVYVDESTFALGDYYFEKSKWKDALKYYGRLINKPKSRHYLFSLYKVAWCRYRLSDTRAALKGLEQVYMESRRAKEEGGEEKGKVSSIRLASEALRDIVPFYSEIGDYQQAERYFESLVGGGKPANKMLDRLAYIYANRGNIEAARYLFHRLIEAEPLSPKAFDYQYQIVVNYSSAGKGKIFKTELYNWITNYSPESEWARTNKKDEALLATAYESREKTLRNYVLQQHQQVKKSGAEESRVNAIEWYKLYLRAFQESPNISDMHFYYGELLYDAKKYKEAATQYAWVLDNDTKSKYYKDASINVIIALEHYIPNQQELVRRRDKQGKSTEPIPMDPELTRFVTASKNFIKTYPDDKRVLEIEFKVAQIYYLHNMFKEAIDNFEPIIKKSPKSQAGQDAVNFILDIYNRRGDFVGLKRISEVLLNNKDLSTTPVSTQLKKILVNTKFKNAQQLGEEKNFYASGESFEKFAGENPGSDLAVKALYNAAYNYREAKAVGPALKMYEGVLAHPDKSPEAKKLKLEASKQLPPLYQQLGNYPKAARNYELFAQANPADPLAANYFFNAAVIWDGLQSYDSALKDYESYHAKEKKGSERVEALYYQAEIWRKRNNLPKAASLYEQYISGPVVNKERIVEAHFKLFEIHKKRGDKLKTNKWRDKTIAVQRSFSNGDKSIGSKYAAEARFHQLHEVYEELKTIAIPANINKQQAAVQKKLALIDRFKNDMSQVLRYASGPQIVASWSTLGMAYGQAAHAIKTAPLPDVIRNLPKEKVAEYQAKLNEGYIKPLEQKAAESYAQAIEDAKRLDVFNEYVITARKNLSKLNPQQLIFVNANIKATSEVDEMGL